MEDINNYDISFSGEFVDKSLEKEFFRYDMKHYSRLIGYIALIFGVIYMLFIVADYFSIEDNSSFTAILAIRALFLTMSLFIFFIVKKINDYSSLAYLITVFEFLAVISFMLILHQYGDISYLSFFSVTALTLAIYITPNKIIYAQIISIILNLAFFIDFYSYMVDIETNVFLKIVAYDLLFIIFGNIAAYITNYYRRKQFAYSKELLKLSSTDLLTGIYNRVKFEQEFNEWIENCERLNKSLSLAIFDVDDFKRINDTYGHLAGDMVLKDIASLIKMSIRSTDIFARWGGDEFVILFPNTDIHQAMEIIERIRICMNKNKYDGVENVACSFGVVSLKKNENAKSLLQRADKLLYEAKEQGKNKILCEIHK